MAEMPSSAGEDLARRVRLCVTLSAACAASMENAGQPCGCVLIRLESLQLRRPALWQNPALPFPVFAGEAADSRRVATDREGIGAHGAFFAPSRTAVLRPRMLHLQWSVLSLKWKRRQALGGELTNRSPKHCARRQKLCVVSQVERYFLRWVLHCPRLDGPAHFKNGGL